MARARHVGNIITFTPPSVRTGVGQSVDCWGTLSSDIYPPQIRHVRKAAARRANEPATSNSIKSAIRGDVRKLGGDIQSSMAKYDKKLTKGA